MQGMDDTRFPGGARCRRLSSSSVRPASTVRPEGKSLARSLDAVTDPELREVMEIVLEEDADLIRYLADR